MVESKKRTCKTFKKEYNKSKKIKEKNKREERSSNRKTSKQNVNKRKRGRADGSNLAPSQAKAKN